MPAIWRPNEKSFQQIRQYLQRLRVVAAGGRYLLARTDTPPEHTLLQLLRDG